MSMRMRHDSIQALDDGEETGRPSLLALLALSWPWQDHSLRAREHSSGAPHPQPPLCSLRERYNTAPPPLLLLFLQFPGEGRFQTLPVLRLRAQAWSVVSWLESLSHSSTCLPLWAPSPSEKHQQLILRGGELKQKHTKLQRDQQQFYCFTSQQ